MATSTGESMQLIKVPFSGQKYFSVDWTWLAKYISTEITEICDC